MLDRASTHLAQVDQEIRETGDVLTVISAVLNAQVAPLSATERDALATVARLGANRLSDATVSLDAMRGGRHV